ncbi:uncharacterized protein LOC124154404 isoform X1 [Ischnura elegans]|uniref:uncharacterized protein LOC124154404 isoform X1 n=1 Tax=Ischnura elegans TaxID=197161 RepID=UPI001ED89C84|nr:uncharacterized protein LOC124154404 isoform X1 [Ischnura elegans]
MKLLNTFSTSSIMSVLILGICLITTFAAAFSPLTYEPGEHYEECHNKIHNWTIGYSMCFEHLFTEEALNETSRLHNGTNCLRCMHICRMQTGILRCINEGSETSKEASNKARTMVPFLVKLVEDLLSGMCDDNGILKANNGTDKQCFRKSWSECTDHIDFVDHLDMVFFCDSANEEKDPFTKEYVCLRLWDFHECMQRKFKNCDPGLMSAQELLGNKIRNSDSCIKYINIP